MIFKNILRLIRKDVICINLGKFENCNELDLINVLKMNNRFMYLSERYVPITNEIVDGIYDWYMISNFGYIYNKFTGEFLTLYPCATSTSGKFYYSVNLSTIYGFKSIMVHRLVLACFHPEMGSINQKLDVNHRDGNKTNNYTDLFNYTKGNLEWATRSENIKHAYETGLQKTGENHANAKISNDVAIQVIKLLAENRYTSKQICEIVNCPTLSTHIVDDIKKHKSYKYLSNGYDFYQRPGKQFTDEQIHGFCKSFQLHKDESCSIKEKCRIALKENGFEPLEKYVETLRKIYVRKYYVEIASQYVW